MSEKIDNENSEPRKIISDGISILGGTYFDGEITLEEEASKEKRLTAEEIMEITSKIKIDTNGWKFNRDEANERR